MADRRKALSNLMGELDRTLSIDEKQRLNFFLQGEMKRKPIYRWRKGRGRVAGR